jgi:predicted nucleic-acid-binding protein
MTNLLIDANALISFITDRIPRQTTIVADLIESASNLEMHITIIGSVINDLVFVLDGVYKCESRFIANIVRDLLKHPGIRFEHGCYPKRILQLWPDQIREYGDAILAAAAVELALPVYTFDKRFYRDLRRSGIRSKLLGQESQ